MVLTSKITSGFRRVVVCVAFLLIVPIFLSAQTRPARESVLIISSYNPDASRMSDFILNFERAMVSSALPCDIYVETLECKKVADAPQWIAQIDQLITRYEPRNLRAIVLLGQEAWASFISLARIPQGVMCFSCFASMNGILLPPPQDATADWMPDAIDYPSQTDSMPLVGGLLNQYDIRRNVELIRSLYPDTKTIAFVSDNTYGGISLQAYVRKEMELYPDLQLVLIDGRQGEQTARDTYAALPPHTVALLGVWRVGADGEYFMQRSLTDLVQTNVRIPVFTVTGTGMGDVAMGGYVPQYQSGSELIASQIEAYYESGHPEKAHFHLSKGAYKFDSHKLKEWKIAEYALPKGSVIEDTLAAKLSKYSHYIELLVMGVGLLVLLLIFVAWLLIRTQRLKRTLEVREDQLVVAREKAEESDMLKSAFLANMSHEIRTPLNAIVGFSSLMQSEDLTHEERTEYSSIVVSNSEMLLTLLNDILDISSLECGKIRFNYEEVDIVPICQHAIMTTAHTRNPEVECHLECSESTFLLTTDMHRLSQVLINLLTNAGKFTTKGSITVGVEVDREQQCVLFSVTDTGPGIPLDKQKQVFERFEKLDGNKKQGTGLGLAICRQIATIVGGRIWVDPTYTGGARFLFLHPIGITPAKSNSASTHL